MVDDTPEANTPETIGNQFGYLCPNCNQGDNLSVVALVSVELCPDGTDADGNHEWDDSSMASCSCGWQGKVSDFKQAENFEGD